MSISTLQRQTSTTNHGEAASQLDKIMAILKDAAFYCLVENSRGRDSALQAARALLAGLGNSIDDNAASPVAGNLKNLFNFIGVSLETVSKTNNVGVVQEFLGILEPIRDGFR
jgi:flagellin-specific chaperone FliS